jgi:predicted MFS family arabinose efflux permease
MYYRGNAGDLYMNRKLITNITSRLNPKNLKRNLSLLRNRLKLYDELSINRRNIALSSYCSGIITNLVGGNFLTGLLLLMNADDAFIGLISMAGIFGNIMQVMSPLLLERFNSRKKILIVGRALFHLFNIAVVGIIPILGYADRVKLTMVFVVILVTNLANAMLAPGYSVWHIKSIPPTVRSRYYSRFHLHNGLAIYSAILLASFIVDSLKTADNEMMGLLLLRGIAIILAALDIYFLTKIKEYPNEKSGTKINLVSVLINPFKERKYLMTVLIACLWSFSANIPSSYYVVYLLKEVGISYSFLNLVNMLSIPALALVMPFWRKRVDSKSWFKTLYFSMGLFLLHYIGLAFVFKNTIFLYPLFSVVAFFISPGINLVFSNIPYINIPEKDQTNYIGFYSAMNNLAAFLGVFVGREFIGYTENSSLSFLGISLGNKQCILLFTAFIMLIAVGCIYIIDMKMVNEEIPVDDCP